MTNQIDPGGQKMKTKFTESGPWFATILKNIRDGVIGIDAEGCIRCMNSVAEVMTGWKQAEASGKDLTEVFRIVGETEAPVDSPLTKVLREGVGVGLAHHTLIDRDGVVRTIDESVAPVRNDRGETIGFVLIFREITAHLEMSKVLKSIVEWAAALLQADAGDIYLYDQEREEFVLAISYGFMEEYTGITIKPGEGIAGRIFQTGQPMIVDDYFTWEGRSPTFAPPRPFTTVLKVPLKWQDQIFGVLGIEADARRRTFGEDDVRLLTLFANLAAVAIENARLYGELQSRMENLKRTLEQEVAERTAELAHRALQLETSARVSREITSILDIDELLTEVVELIREAFNYYYVQVFLVDNAAGQLVLRAGSGEIGRQLKSRGLQLEIGSGSLNGLAVQTNAAVLVNDTSGEARYLPDDLLPDTRSELVIPLRVGEQVVGTLDVQSAKVNAFSKEDALVIQSLGDQVAIALENARLYDRSRELAVLKERNRLARELHDSVTQSIFSMDLHARAISTYLHKQDLERAEVQVQQLRQVTHDTLQEMRSLIFDLRPASLEDTGLVPALHQQVERLRRPDGPELVLQATDERRLSGEVEQGLFRIAQEALRNAVKHGGAQRIEVVLTMEPKRITLCVTDDGRGFDPASPPADRRAFGLIGMNERAELLGGSFQIVSQPGAGTRVEVHVPIQGGKGE